MPTIALAYPHLMKLTVTVLVLSSLGLAATAHTQAVAIDDFNVDGGSSLTEPGMIYFHLGQPPRHWEGTVSTQRGESSLGIKDGAFYFDQEPTPINSFAMGLFAIPDSIQSLDLRGKHSVRLNFSQLDNDLDLSFSMMVGFHFVSEEGPWTGANYHVSNLHVPAGTRSFMLPAVGLADDAYFQWVNQIEFDFTTHGGQVKIDSIEAVPEPGSCALLGLGGLVCLRRRSKLS